MSETLDYRPPSGASTPSLMPHAITVYVQNGEVQYVAGIPETICVRVVRQDPGGEIAGTEYWHAGGYRSREIDHVTYPDERSTGHESAL